MTLCGSLDVNLSLHFSGHEALIRLQSYNKNSFNHPKSKLLIGMTKNENIRNFAFMKKNTLFVLMALLGLFSCQKSVTYPIEPEITYQGLTYLMDADSTLTGEVVFNIGYTDGDGDLGLDDSDSLYPFGIGDPYYYNLLIDYLKWDGAQFVETPLLSWNQQTQSYDTISFNARFKRLVFYDEEKAISGTFNYKMMLYNPASPNDTVKLRARIVDRALHISNPIETESIFFDIN